MVYSSFNNNFFFTYAFLMIFFFLLFGNLSKGYCYWPQVITFFLLSLCLSTLISLYFLSLRFVNLYNIIIGVYGIFVIIAFLLVFSIHLYLFFLWYEGFLLTSVIILFISSPNNRGLNTSLYFLFWTQIGSLFILLSIFLLTFSNNIYYFDDSNVVINYHILISILLFIGFGINLPCWPFYFWLPNVHVEAPTSFSVLLSGFLVNISLLGFYNFYYFFHFYILLISLFFFLISIGVSAILFLFQTDYNNLIAYTTIHEMNVLMLFLMLNNSNNLIYLLYGLILHTIISLFYFSIADYLFKLYNSRSIFSINGLIYLHQSLFWIILFSLLFFNGLPFTLKFLYEMNLYMFLFQNNYLVGVYLSIFSYLCSNLFFFLLILN